MIRRTFVRHALGCLGVSVALDAAPDPGSAPRMLLQRNTPCTDYMYRRPAAGGPARPCGWFEQAAGDYVCRIDVDGGVDFWTPAAAAYLCQDVPAMPRQTVALKSPLRRYPNMVAAAAAAEPLALMILTGDLVQS